jgi:DNA-binding MarR family transcriptional regulator
MSTPDRKLANETWMSLFTAHTTLMKEFAAAEIWRDVSMREYDVLYTLSKCDEPIRLNELNRHLLLSQPALSRMVDRLVERGWVLRTGDPIDRRGCRLSLTDAGRAEQRHIGGRHGIHVARAMTANLDDDDLRRLGDLCRRLVDTSQEAIEERGIPHHDATSQEP